MSAAVEETSLGMDHRKLAMWIFLGSEFLFFGAFITAYVLYVDKTNGGPGVELFAIPFTSVSSFVLVMSSLTFCKILWRLYLPRLVLDPRQT